MTMILLMSTTINKFTNELVVIRRSKNKVSREIVVESP